MTTKKPAFAKYIVTQLENDAILAVGDCGTYLRLSVTETYSNLREAVDGVLVPQYTELLNAALEYAKVFKSAAALNTTLVAHAFLEQLREDIGEENFTEVCRLQREKPIAGICYSNDYCDANETMAEAMASLGLDLMGAHDGKNSGPEYDRLVDLWSAAWDHAKTRMEAMTL